MKKHILYSCAVLVSLALASCNGDYDDWASPQGYEQEAAAAAYGVSASAGSGANIQMPVADDAVNLVNLSAQSSEVTGFTVRKLTVNGTEVSSTISNGNIVVSAAELSSLIQNANFSRAHKTYDLDVVLAYGANLSNGDAVAFDAVTSAKLTTQATPAEDENGYFLLGDFEGQGWDATNPIWMTNNGDGTYTATVTTKSDGSNWYKFYQGSHFVSGDWDSINEGQMGCAENGDASLKGLIVWNGDAEHADGVQTPTITGAGKFEITIDAINYTYTVTRAESKYYVVGTPQGWSGDDKSCMFYSLGNNIYTYTTSWTGAWDLKVWDSKNFGNWDNCWGTKIDGDGSESGTLINVDAKSFQSPSAGYYTLTINMSDNTYSWEAVTPANEYTSVSLIGDFNGWGDDIDLTQVAGAPHNWYGRVTIPSDGGLKFRADHAWDNNWGAIEKVTPMGDIYYLEPGGENINVPAGTYDFYLNDITGNWNIVLVEE